jgi:histidine ammonia-lyase
MLTIDGRSLTLEEVELVAAGDADVETTAEARAAMARSRGLVEEKVASGEVVYGVTTGFGRLADVPIPGEDREELQHNLLRSHAAGTGPFLSRAEVRALLLLRANALALGHSGIRPEVVDRILLLLNRRIHPAVPEAGSVGASGDLAPLAHMALPLIGEGEVLGGPEEGDEMARPSPGDPPSGPLTLPAAAALSAAGVDPLRLEAKEGLALINGTQATTALGILTWHRALRALETLEGAGAMSLEALRGTPEAFRPEVQAVRPHPEQAVSAGRLRGLLRGSEIRESHREGDPRVQDAYSLRCMPQVHGAARSVMGYVEGVLVREANSATDNPLLFPETGSVVSAGNFHAQIVAQALDFLCIAVADLAAISERRLERLLNPDLSGLPAFLTPRSPGLHSGLMILQVTVVDLLAELRVLAHPVSVDSVPTSANQEDHVSMGMAAARKARRAVELLESVVAAELMAAAQGLEFRRPLRAGEGVEWVHARVRNRVAPLDGDRSPAPDLAALRDEVRDGGLVPPSLYREEGRR